MKVYIAGGMTGLPNNNREAFNLAAQKIKLKIEGAVILNPAILPIGLSEADYMAICLPMLMASDTIYMLDGWEVSKGAQAEYALAVKLGMGIIHADNKEINPIDAVIAGQPWLIALSIPEKRGAFLFEHQKRSGLYDRHTIKLNQGAGKAGATKGEPIPQNDSVKNALKHYTRRPKYSQSIRYFRAEKTMSCDDIGKAEKVADEITSWFKEKNTPILGDVILANSSIINKIGQKTFSNFQISEINNDEILDSLGHVFRITTSLEVIKKESSVNAESNKGLAFCFSRMIHTGDCVVDAATINARDAIIKKLNSQEILNLAISTLSKKSNHNDLLFTLKNSGLPIFSLDIDYIASEVVVIDNFGTNYTLAMGWVHEKRNS